MNTKTPEALAIEEIFNKIIGDKKIPNEKILEALALLAEYSPEGVGVACGKFAQHRPRLFVAILFDLENSIVIEPIGKPIGTA